MITDIVNGMLLVAAEDFRAKVNRTICATPQLKIGAILGGERDYYCIGIFATPKWFAIADNAVMEMNDDRS